MGGGKNTTDNGNAKKPPDKSGDPVVLSCYIRLGYWILNGVT